MNRTRVLIGWVVLVTLVFAPCWAADKRMTIEDALALKSAGNFAWTPDSNHLVFTIREWKRDDNRYITHIYRIPREGGEPVQLTRGERGESRPRLSPDGTLLAFSANRAEKGGGQIWLLPLAGGEAYQLTEEENGVSGFEWAPDSKSIAFTTRDVPEDKESREKKKKDRFDAVVVDSDFRWTHIWVIGLKDKEKQRLTEGAFNVAQIEWSPSGERIAAVVNYNPSQESSWRHIDDNRESDILLIPATGGEPENLTPHATRSSSPAWSPDGSALVFSENEDVTVWASISNLIRVDLETGRRVNLTEKERDSVGGAQWTADGKHLYFSQGKSVYTQIYRIPERGGDPQAVTRDQGIRGGFEISPDGGYLAFSLNDPTRPGDIWISKIDGTAASRLTDLNPQIADFDIAPSQAIQWKAPDGWQIEGVLTLPLDYREGQSYPLILQIHGGPYGRFSRSFSSRNQIFAANGYAILQPNPRGSTGYGIDFTVANVEDWGGKDFHNDDMSGVDHVVEMGVADPDRLVVMGGSYGGFSTFWAVTQTDRFKAAIGHAGISDWYSFHGQSDIPGLMEYGFGGYPWDAAETYRKYSPMTYVDQVKTPIMITHGERDMRVPIAQAEQYYTALKKRGVDVQFVRYPREGHGIREPNHVIDLVGRQLEWFDRHLGIERPKTEVEEGAQ